MIGTLFLEGPWSKFTVSNWLFLLTFLNFHRNNINFFIVLLVKCIFKLVSDQICLWFLTYAFIIFLAILIFNQRSLIIRLSTILKWTNHLDGTLQLNLFLMIYTWSLINSPWSIIEIDFNIISFVFVVWDKPPLLLLPHWNQWLPFEFNTQFTFLIL